MGIRHGWKWVPTLYLAEGLPYALVNLLSIAVYKDFGVSNADIAFYTSWLYLPWVIKPLWSPFVDVIRTKRFWVLAMQALVGVATAAVAFSLKAPYYFQLSIAILWLVAFASSTHDIAADGYYMLAQGDDDQAFFVGIRSTFYKISQWLGNGALLIVVGHLQRSNAKVYSWMVALMILAGVFIGLSLYHLFAMPDVEKRGDRKSVGSIFRGIADVFVSFFSKRGVWITLLFILTYRLGEAMIVKMKTPFLLDAADAGGLGLSLAECGLLDGTIGMVCMVVGGIAGGIALSRRGLDYWMWIMLACMALPNAVYIYMAYFQPDSLWIIGACVGVEQLGYGFGFTAFSMYLMRFAKGAFATSHFALCTGFMALGMMLPGMVAGAVQTALGYPLFFVLVFVLGLVPFLVVRWTK